MTEMTLVIDWQELRKEFPEVGEGFRRLQASFSAEYLYTLEIPIEIERPEFLGKLWAMPSGIRVIDPKFKKNPDCIKELNQSCYEKYNGGRGSGEYHLVYGSCNSCYRFYEAFRK